MSGAKGAFEILQKGWNDGDLSEIRGLTTDAMFGQVQDQFRGRPSRTRHGAGKPETVNSRSPAWAWAHGARHP